MVCQYSWLLLVTVYQIYEFRLSFHAKMDIPDTLNLWCQIKDILLICWILSEIFFYGMVFCFESLHYDIALGIRLVISDGQMHFMVFLRFCTMSHPAIRMSNLLIFADFSEYNFFAKIQCLFSYPIIFQGKNSYPNKNSSFLFQPPSKYLPPQSR